MNYDGLKAELQNAKYTSMSDEQAKADLNDVSIAMKKAIPSHSIRKYLFLRDKLIPLEESNDPSAIAAVRALEILPPFDVREPIVSVKLTLLLDSLVTAGLISTTDNAIIQSMGDGLISRAEQLKLGLVKVGDVTFARGL